MARQAPKYQNERNERQMFKTNAERAAKAERSLLTYLEGEEVRAAEILAGNDDMAREAIQDQINDLLHLLNRKSIDLPVEAVMWTAFEGFEEELAEEAALADA